MKKCEKVKDGFLKLPSIENKQTICVIK